MSMATMEASVADGAPVELYHFAYTGRAYTYTSADEPVEYNTRSYTPLPITRSAIAPAVDKAKGTLTLNMPRTFPLADMFRVSPPSEVVSLTIYRRHRGDAEFAAIWQGRMTDMKLDSFGVEVLFEDLMSSMQRGVLTRQYSRACTHLLYGTGCGVSKAANQATGTATAVSGNSVTTLLGQAAGYFNGGTLEYMSAVTGLLEYRFVTDFSAGVFTLDRTAYGLTLGQQVFVYPGCDHSLDSCKNKFNNVERYGGYPNMPSKNPFSGVKIF